MRRASAPAFCAPAVLRPTARSTWIGVSTAHPASARPRVGGATTRRPRAPQRRRHHHDCADGDDESSSGGGGGGRRVAPPQQRQRRQRQHVTATAAGSNAPSPSPSPSPPSSPAGGGGGGGGGEFDPRGINGTAAFYVAIVAAQVLPFVSATSGLAGDAAYFVVTAISSIIIGVRRAPLEPPELAAPLQSTQALAAPFTASLFLFGTYLLLKYTSLDVGLLFNALTTLSGTLCLKESLDPVFHSALAAVALQDVVVIPGEQEEKDKAETNTAAAAAGTEAGSSAAPNDSGAGEDEEGKEAQQQEQEQERGLRPAFTLANTLATASALGVTGLYLSNAAPNFVFSNVIAVALCTRILSLIRPSSFAVAAGLLGGLFFYDIFWVFGSEVMVSVATQIDSPGKLLFPRGGFGAAGAGEYPYAILGLGDVCVPGIFISLAQSLDTELVHNNNNDGAGGEGEEEGGGAGGENKKKMEGHGSPYFTAAVVAYIAALLTCFGVNLYTKAAQPALLYLVPALIGSSVVTAAVRGELEAVLRFKVGSLLGDGGEKQA